MRTGGNSVKLQTGRWTKSEHNCFMNSVEMYGKNWFQVQKKVKTRTIEQVRSHAQKVFMGMSKADVRAMF